MRFVQFKDRSYGKRVAVVRDDGAALRPLKNVESMYGLILQAIETNQTLDVLAMQTMDLQHELDYDEIVSENRLLQPVDHPDPAHFLVSGTGLDHLGSALARNAMHAETGKETDSMKMFKLGLKDGKPDRGQVGSQPEWFYKGDGSCVVPPGQPLELPSFALNGGEEAEIAGLYVISKTGEVFRAGFALGNEYSDHVLEKENYLYLAHSKLRQCSFGPELLTGTLPIKVDGRVRLLRDGGTIWESDFSTGEANMTHSISNIEYHHFKYPSFRRPGDVHCHFLGASAISFSAGILAKVGDVFEVSSPPFGRPLKNPLKKGTSESPKILTL
jgi:hypothetical protein